MSISFKCYKCPSVVTALYGNEDQRGSLSYPPELPHVTIFFSLHTWHRSHSREIGPAFSRNFFTSSH